MRKLRWSQRQCVIPALDPWLQAWARTQSVKRAASESSWVWALTWAERWKYKWRILRGSSYVTVSYVIHNTQKRHLHWGILLNSVKGLKEHPPPQNKAGYKFLCVFESQSSKISVWVTCGFSHFLKRVPFPSSCATHHVLGKEQIVISVIFFPFPSFSRAPLLTLPSCIFTFKNLIALGHDW